MSILTDRFWGKVRKTDYCWIWQGAVNTKGYGCFLVDGVSQLVHRLAYEDAHGPIPDGMTIDHRCRVRNCVNPSPDHLEVVTVAENNRRKKTAHSLAVGDECIYGHRITELTLYVRPSGVTECRECRRIQKEGRKAS